MKTKIKKKPLKLSRELVDQLNEIGIDYLQPGENNSLRYCLYCNHQDLSCQPIPERPYLLHCVVCDGVFVEH